MMNLSFKQIEFHDTQNNEFRLQISFRKYHFHTHATNNSETLLDKKHYFPLTYHSLLFDSLKINLQVNRPFVGWKKFGTVRLRIAKLPTQTGHFIQYFIR